MFSHFHHGDVKNNLLEGFKLSKQALVNISDNIVESGNVVAMTNSRPVVENNFAQCLGASGDYFWTADSAANSVAGDIEITLKLAADSWTLGNDIPFAKMESTNQRSYFVSINSDGTISLATSSNGTGAGSVSGQSTAIIPAADGVAIWVKLTLDVDDGAGNRVYKFYTSTNGETYTQLGDTVTTSGTTSIFDSTSIVEVGGSFAGTNQLFFGKVFSAQVRDGIDGVLVVDFNPPDFIHGNSVFNSALTGEQWTIAGNNYVVEPRIATGTGEADTHAVLDGVSGTYVHTPDSVANSITGDIDFRFDGALDDWSNGANQGLIGKKTDAGDERSYVFRIGATGIPEVLWYTDGTAVSAVIAVSTAAVSFANGARGQIRVTLDVDNGASGTDVTFYTATDGVNWTQLGDVVIGGAITNIFDGTSKVSIGAQDGSGTQFRVSGSIYSAQIYKGIDGTKVLDFNAADHTHGATLNSYETGEQWTLAGAALISSYNLNVIAGTAANLKQSLSGATLCYGASGDYGSSPDSAAASVTNGIDLIVYATPNDWTPSADETLISKYLSAGNQRSYYFDIDTVGGLLLGLSQDGISGVEHASTAATGFADGTGHWVRATWDNTDNLVTFYTSSDPKETPTNSVTWVQLGATVVSTRTGIFDSTSLVEVGARQGGTGNNFSGSIQLAQIYNGIDGTLAVDFNAADYVNRTSDTAFNTTIGAELVTNGDFDTDSDWTNGAGWSISGGLLNCSGGGGGAVSTNIGTVVIGQTYLATFTVVSGSGFVSLNAGVAGTTRSTTGTFTEVVTATATTIAVQQRGAGFTGAIDNVSVIQVTPWTLNGNTFIQNTGYPVVHSIGSVSIKPSVAKEVANGLAIYLTGRISDTPAANSYMCSAYSDATKRSDIFTDDLAADKFTMRGSSNNNTLTEAFDNDAHLFTAEMSAAVPKLTVSGVGEVVGIGDSNVYDYGTFFAYLNDGSTMKGYIGDVLIQDAAFGVTNLQHYLQNKRSI